MLVPSWRSNFKVVAKFSPHMIHGRVYYRRPWVRTVLYCVDVLIQALLERESFAILNALEVFQSCTFWTRSTLVVKLQKCRVWILRWLERAASAVDGTFHRLAQLESCSRNQLESGFWECECEILAVIMVKMNLKPMVSLVKLKWSCGSWLAPSSGVVCGLGMGGGPPAVVVSTESRHTDHCGPAVLN